MLQTTKSRCVFESMKSKEKASKNKRRDLLYLILNFLQEECLLKTAESLIFEAQLSNDVRVCDNINLEVILHEYCNYYMLKFDRIPSICKTEDKHNNKIIPNPPNIQQHKINPKKEEQPNKERKNVCNNDLTKVIKINALLTEEKEDKDGDEIKNTIIKSITTFLENVPNETKEFLRNIYLEAKLLKHTPVKWEDVKGLDNAKMVLQEASILPLQYSHLFVGLTSPWKTILLYGPPGGGKTLLAKALATESNRVFFNITPSTILSKWRGDSEKYIKALFDLARYVGPSIILMDEIDSIASKRDSPTEHEASRRLKSEMLIELDGFKDNSCDILFLATSNLPWEIDHAILRRMEKRIYIPLPNMESRIQIFKSKILTKENINFDELAINTDYYSGSDIHIVCKEASMMSIRRALKNKHVDSNSNHILKNDLLQAIMKTKPLTKNSIERYTKWAEHNGAE